MAGQVVINIVAVRLAAGGITETNAEAAAVAAAVRDAWQTNLMPKLSTDYKFVQVTARGVIEPAVSGSAPATLAAGAIAGPGLPTFAVAKVRIQTATPGRAGRGRTGLSGVDEGSTAAGSVNRLVPAAVTTYQTAINGFQSALLASALGLSIVVVSRFKGVDGTGKPVPRPGGPLVSDATALTVDGELGTRVSRLR